MVIETKKIMISHLPIGDQCGYDEKQTNQNIIADIKYSMFIGIVHVFPLQSERNVAIPPRVLWFILFEIIGDNDVIVKIEF